MSYLKLLLALLLATTQSNVKAEYKESHKLDDGCIYAVYQTENGNEYIFIEQPHKIHHYVNLYLDKDNNVTMWNFNK